MILEARGVGCAFGATRALDGVDLAVRGGEIVALLGGNGAGKSTLLRVLSGERPADTGSVTVDGEPVSGRDPEWRGRVGLVSHRTGLYRNLTVRENLLFFAGLHRVPDPRARAAEAARSVGVADLLERLVASLSRGQRQRVALARTALHDPAVLLLDEPFTGLDPLGGQAVSRLLTRARTEGKLVVLVTHDVPHALSLADRTVVLRRGRKVLDAASGECSLAEVHALFGVEEVVLSA